MSAVQNIIVNADENDTRLDRWIKRRFVGLAQGKIEKALRAGQIRVDGKKSKSGFRLKSGMEVRLPPFDVTTPSKPASGRITAKDRAFIKSLVLYDDDAILALNKPSGLAVQGGTGTKRHIDGMLPGFDEGEHLPKLVHRLDRDTSGLLVLGRSPVATASLAKSFKSRKVQKTYLAITLGVPRPEQGVVKGYMKKGIGAKEREIMMWARHGDRAGQYSRTIYTVLARAGQKAALVALRPETGRTHQLRFHMAETGFAISGDYKYVCDRDALGGLPDRLMLHAHSLRLPHPNGGTFDLTAPFPAHFKTAMEMLGFDESIPADPFVGME